MAESPLKQKLDLVTYSILVNGQEISTTMVISTIEVSKEVNKIPHASFTVIDGNKANMTYEASEKDTFKPGNSVKITAGYHQVEKTIFEGIIISHGIRIPDDSVPLLTVKCIDKAAKMAVDRKNTNFPDMKDSEVMSKLIGNYGLSAKVEATKAKHERVVQFQASDWDTLVTRADANGMIVVVDDGKISVKKPATSNDVISLTMGTDIKGLHLDIDARHQVKKVSTQGWNFSNHDLTKSEGSEPSSPSHGNMPGSDLSGVLGSAEHRIHSSAPLLPDEAKALADSKQMRSRYSLLRGTISFLGHAAPKPDTTIKLSGLGSRMTGSAYVSGVLHKLKAGSWDTEVTIGLSHQTYTESQKDVGLPPASGLFPPVHGIHQGLVKKIHDDPQNESRILVDVPLIDESGQGIWARQALYYGTNAAGNFFYPEIGDEVLVAFVNSDPRFPIIVGSVYSKKHAPAYTPDAPNTYKAITTNSKMKIEFEDVKKIITIWTPNKNFIEINDEKQSITIQDETNNKMVMDPKGITWTTPKDFKLTATGKIEIKAQQTISMEATQDFSIKGLNVKSEAQVGNTMKGSASATVTASGSTTIKGGIVQIN
jgi:Rhs element Vgr protein